MPLNRRNPPSTLLIQDKYLDQQPSSMTRPVNRLPAPGIDPLAADWSYNDAVNLFSLSPADMDPMCFDNADTLANTDAKVLFMDPLASGPWINEFIPPAAEDTVSLSSDLDSDDQSLYRIISLLETQPEQARHGNPSTSLLTPTSTTSSARWSSSHELPPQEPVARDAATLTNTAPSLTITQPTIHKARSFSQDSTLSSTPSPPAQDPPTRNAAKRAAHNKIEKRYRTNINAKFLALEQAISPSGSGVHKTHTRGGARPLKKSEILTNALAYIEDLQRENLALRENVAPSTRDRGLKTSQYACRGV